MSTNNASDDEESGRLSGQSRARRAAHGKRRQNHFIKGPIPMPWLESAGAIGGKSMNLAAALWFKHGIVGGGWFTVSHKLLDRFCVKRHASGRILKAMSDRGLIQLVKADGNAPKVRVIPAAGRTPAPGVDD